MKGKLTKIEVNNEISRIKNLLKEKREDEAKEISINLAKRLYVNENEDSKYFNEEGKILLSKYFLNICTIEEINVDYLISNIEILGKENLKGTIVVDVIEKLKALK
ncbi:MAG: hypothetical protein SPH93_02485 [Clostridium sp.]|uniref:hypothetical protein n=1 Tax=Clostridium sp. TaxID=1506 RepID=UPI002A91B515|nr:hypothetical protein [Clostridium sp.]MDY6226538.1 hypothetical protein [Clostridium sp.]